MTWGHGQGEEGDRKPWTQHSRRMSLHVCAWLRAVISGVWRCVIFAIFSPQKKTRRWSPWRHKTTKVEPSPGAGAGWRVGEAFLQHTAPFRSGWVLQTLVGAQESFAVGTVVVHVLQGVHTERDEAAACDAPGTKQATHTACYCDLDGSHQTDTCVRAQAVSNSATPWTVAHQASLAMGLSRQEYWSGLPCPSPGDLPNSGIKPMSLVSPALAGRFFTSWATREIIVSFKMSAIIELYKLVQKQMKNYCDWARARVPTAQKTKLWQQVFAAKSGFIVEYQAREPKRSLRSTLWVALS